VDSVLAASPVSVASGGTLGGIGQVGGTVTLASGGHVGRRDDDYGGQPQRRRVDLSAGALLDHEIGDLVTVHEPGRSDT
jgi:hypothetical protein